MDVRGAGEFVLARLNAAGYAAYFVGGMVRDDMLGLEVFDVDVTTSALPEDVRLVFDRVYDTGISHGTVTVVVEDVAVEVTTFRVDGDYLDSRRPDGVVFTASLDLDLKRRDFTINAMARSIDGKVHDPFGGILDLSDGLIRAVGEARVRFEEDALRILRAIRFVSKLGFDVEEQTIRAMKECAFEVSNLSWERVRKEFVGIILGDSSVKAFGLLFETDVFASLEFFSVLCNFELFSFEQIDSLVCLLALVAVELDDMDRFLGVFPFTRLERKLVRDVVYARECELDPRVIQYRYGIDVARVSHALECFYEQRDGCFSEANLIIDCRKDLAVTTSDILEFSGRSPGDWLGRTFQMLEECVLLGRIPNRRQDIFNFINDRGLVDEKED